jgi:hypothetical protein
MPMTNELGYLPIALHKALLRICEPNNLSIKEVAIVLISKMLEDKYEFHCDHKRVREAKDTHRPYCFDCWRRLDEIDVRNKRVKKVNGRLEIAGVVYKESLTFLDLLSSQQEQQQSKENKLERVVSLSPEEIQELR